MMLLKRVALLCLIFVIVIVVVVVVVRDMQVRDSLRHDTARWAVIEDLVGDRIVVEPLSDQVWSQLFSLHQNGSRRWVGGIVEEYDNSWGFRFRPDSIVVAEVTAEGLQTNVRSISEDLDYWKGGYAYVSALVVEVHS